MARDYVVIGYRANAAELALIDSKAKASGLGRSEFLRRLVELAEVEPVKIRLRQRRPRKRGVHIG